MSIKEMEREGITTLSALTINSYTNITIKIPQRLRTMLKISDFLCTKDIKRMSSPKTHK